MPDATPPDEIIQRAYLDAGGETRHVAPEVVDHLHQLIGDEETADGPLVVRRGAPIGRGTVRLEDGGELDVVDSLPADAPFGYHRFVDEQGDRTLIVSPGACQLDPDWRTWGWAVQLYAARSRASWGIGDLGDLDRLARWGRDLGAGFLLVNPLRAAAPGAPQQASPYSPTSRRFLSPLYIDVEAVAASAGSEFVGPELAELGRRGRALGQDRLIDRDRAAALKDEALSRIWAVLWRSGSRPDGFEDWLRRRDDVRQFAIWMVLAEQHGSSWRSWPAAYRNPANAEVARFGEERAERVAYHAWLQWLASHQLQGAADTIDIVQDLPIGFDAEGADAWSWQDLLAEGVSVGAPPDTFNRDGQDWGLPAFIPWRLRQADYGPFIDSIRTSMISGGGLRIDHVMGLFRLWWIPGGSGPVDGAYVTQPAQDLLDIVALESHRHGAVVIGEDLGTLAPGVREELAARNILSYRLLWFEEERPSAWPAQAMAAVTTHDLPTAAGLWSGSDLARLRELGISTDEEATGEIRERVAEWADLPEDAGDDEAVAAAYGLIGEAPSAMLCATLEDALLQRERPNIPGSGEVNPNWSIALERPIDDLADASLAATIAGVLNAAVSDADAPPAGHA